MTVECVHPAATQRLPARCVLGRVSPLAVAMLLCAGVLPKQSLAQTTDHNPDASPSPPPPFRFFRYDDDPTLYRIRPGDDPFDSLKFLPLTEAGNVYLSFGGELREWYNSYNEPFFGLPGQRSSDEYLLQRFTVFSDLRVDDHLRAFVELGSYLETGKESPLYVFDEDKLDVQQAFAEMTFGDADSARVTVRGGRQEMGYGSYRLVQARDAGNVRLNYDGLRLIVNDGDATVSAFYVVPVDLERGYFDNGENDGQRFWGVYSTFAANEPKTTGIDLYYLGFQRKDAVYGHSSATQTVHTIGVRAFGTPTEHAGLDYDVEAAGQIGSYGDRSIAAFMTGANVGYTFDASWKPRIGLKVDAASGGGTGGGTLHTFYPLYPSITYYSQAQYFTPANFFDVHPSLSAAPMEGLSLAVDADVYFRYSNDDAVYTPRGALIRPDGGGDRYVGTTLGCEADYAVDRHSVVSAYYVHFFAGDVVRKAAGRDSDYVGLLWTFKF